MLADNNQFYGIDIIKFGNDINEIRDRETFDHESILILLKKSMEMFNKYYTYEVIEGAARNIVELLPERAFREAIANAITHRQWDTNTYIRISMYNDRIEITSPGGLPAGLSEDEYLHGQVSILRNPTIAGVLYRLRYIEKFGTGILRINSAYSNALVKPEYSLFDNSITITLPVISANQKLFEGELIIIEALKGNKKLSRNEIEKDVQFSKDKTLKILNNLIKKNIVTKSDVGRTTKYYLL